MIAGIGNAAVRKCIQGAISKNRVITFIYLNAVVENNVVIRMKSVIMVGAVINPGSKVGKECI